VDKAVFLLELNTPPAFGDQALRRLNPMVEVRRSVKASSTRMAGPTKVSGAAKSRSVFNFTEGMTPRQTPLAMARRFAALHRAKKWLSPPFTSANKPMDLPDEAAHSL
jgi:hypothetical protein